MYGFIAGLTSGFFGAGGGLLLVPFFGKFLKMDARKARATAITIILFLVLGSSFFYLKNGDINWNIAVFCVIGGFVGSFLGSKILKNTSSKILNIIFIIFLLYSGIKMLL